MVIGEYWSVVTGFAYSVMKLYLAATGPFAWVMASPDEPVPESQPNEGSIKARGRNRKKRARQRISFMAVFTFFTYHFLLESV